MAINRTKEEWAALIARQRSSGQSVKVWCAANGVNYHTFVDRASRNRSESKQLSPGWVEVREDPAPAKTSKSEIEVKTGAFTIAVPEDFNEAGFKRVCKVLTTLC